jgi:hypothetical protein
VPSVPDGFTRHHRTFGIIGGERRLVGEVRAGIERSFVPQQEAVRGVIWITSNPTGP